MNPITRRLLRQADEAEAGSPYPARPARCAARIVRYPYPGAPRYTSACKRPARASGLCWQHERSATDAPDPEAVIASDPHDRYGYGQLADELADERSATR